MKLYHGSPVESFRPQFGLGDDEHDYGRGFYTTPHVELGREWAGVQYFFRSRRSFDALKENEGEKEFVLGSVYRMKYDERDRLARAHMREIAYDVARNPIVRTFSAILQEEPK